MSRRGGILIFAFCFLGASSILWAQNAGPDEVRGSSRPYVPPTPPPSGNAITVKTTVVAVGVVVRDTKGKTIADLKRGDFQIFDNGKPQPISAFSIETIAPHADAAQAVAKPASDAATGAASIAATPTAGPTSPRPPRFIALYFDDVHTEPGEFQRAKVAAKGLVQNGVEPGDKIGLFTGSSTVTLDFTDDSAKVIAAIDNLNSHPRMASNGLPGCPKITPYEGYLVANRLDVVIHDRLVEDAKRCMCEIDTGDASCIDRAQHTVEMKAEETWNLAEEVSQITLETLRRVVVYLATAPGERVLVLASSGFLNGGLTLGRQQDSIVDFALRSGIVINSIDVKGLATGGPGGAVDGLKEINKDTEGMNPYALMYDSVIFGQKLTSMNSSMWELADATGGTFFHNNNDLGKGFHRLADAPEIEYGLSYSPENLKDDGKYHKIMVKLVDPRSYLVQARSGYFAPVKETKKAAAASAAAALAPPAILPIDREVLATDSMSEVTAALEAKPGKNDKGENALLATIHVDVKTLSFQHKDDRSIQKLTFVVALFDEQGKFAVGEQGEMNLALKESSLGRFDETGLSAKMWLHAPPGRYRLRAVAQEAVNGKMFTVSQPVEIQ